MTTISAFVKLPVIFCSGCATQLVSHICAIVGTDDLICIFCARDKQRAGLGLTVAPVYPVTGWAGMGFAPALDPVDGITLLVRHGAQIFDSKPS
jgi:hypothetical protein